jgi:hypothetical protein
MFTKLQRDFHWRVASEVNTRPRAFVCVTGQLERLELENKMHTARRPLRAAGCNVKLGLVLSEGEAGFTNSNHPKLTDIRPNDTIPLYTNSSQVIAYLDSHSFHVLSDAITYPRIENPAVHKQYIDSLYQAQNLVRSRNDQRKRTENHGRIFESYERCLDIAETSKRPYDLYLRIRDDVGLEKRLTRETFLNVPSNSIVVSSCRG